MAALLALAAPLMANRLVLNLLQSTETIMIPERLTVYGLTRSQAVRTYGTLTGMAMPFVLFPSALVNSLAVVLLPVTARHQSAGNDFRDRGRDLHGLPLQPLPRDLLRWGLHGLRRSTWPADI